MTTADRTVRNIANEVPGINRGGQQNWAERSQPQNAIDQARQIVTASKNDKKRRIKEFINNDQRNIFKGQPLSNILDVLKKDPEGVDLILRQFEDYIRPKNFTSSQLGISYDDRKRYDRELNQAMNEVAQEKLGFLLTGDNIRAIIDHYNITDVKAVKKLKELILLDDWDMIVPMAVKAFEEYGPSAIGYLWDKFVKPTMARAGITGLDFRDTRDDNINEPSKQNIIPNVNTFSEKLKDLSGSEQLLVSAVNRDYLATLVCPERYCFRRPMDYPKRTALVSGSTQFILRSNDDGNTAFYISPWNATLPVLDNAATKFFGVYNMTDIDPSDGSWTAGNSTFLNAPLSPTNLNRWTLTALAIVCTPISSNDSSAGSFQMAYFPEVGLGAIQPKYPQEGLAQSGYYQSGNALNTYRMIWTPTSYGETMYSKNDNLGFQDGFYGLLTGCEPNSAIAKVDIFYVYEIIPTLAQTQYSVVDFATPGVRTNDAITTALYVSPGIEMLTYQEAYDLAMCYKNTQPTYDGVIVCTLEKLLTIKHKVPRGFQVGPGFLGQGPTLRI